MQPMFLNWLIFFLPLVTVIITVLNSSAFVFLVADERLTEYITCSSIYSLAVWVSHWVVPSIHKFEKDKLPDIRLMQFLLSGIGILLFNGLVPGEIAIAFSFLLILECVFFHSGLLVIYSMTSRFHILEVSRGILNLGNLVLCIFVFARSPSYLVWGQAINVGIIGIISFYVGNRALTAGVAVFSRRTISQTVRAALKSQNTRLMLLARFLEIGIILALTHLETLGALVTVKFAVMVAQALALNARAISTSYIMALTLAVLTLGLGAVIEVNAVLEGFLPEALRSIVWRDLTVALIFQIPFTWLLCRSLRSR
ncbi:hypothetical protein OIU14_13590 [Thalassobacter stenotrophicus]|uniref:hypothetical protein n=1 Tax=Thalassobacter stenotrophicus TaxID=266809 RepID=UPI0022A8F6A9|nr:hypothetical protein [Thalassobacter stenotrophicus]UYP67500.1 hypothetical protein OIU14_13590 [Thalassobacter stenotrophicus]